MPPIEYGFGWRITGETLWHSGETVGFRNVIVRYPQPSADRDRADQPQRSRAVPHGPRDRRPLPPMTDDRQGVAAPAIAGIDSGASTGQTWFGQPRGLTVIFLTEMWEKFSYYGMRAMLVYYMTRQLLMPQQHASLVYGTYTAFVYFTPIVGGAIADRWLGKHRAVIVGASLMALGHFMMTFEPLFYFALAVDRSGQRLFPAEPAEPDQGALRTGRPAPRRRLQRLLCRHQCRRIPRAARLRHDRRTLWLALRLRTCGRRHAGWARDLHRQAQGTCRSRRCAQQRCHERPPRRHSRARASYSPA